MSFNLYKMFCKSLLLICLLLVVNSTIQCSATFNITITPKHSRISEDPTMLTLICATGVPLSGCQFTWRDEKTTGPILELSNGPATEVNTAHLTKFLTTYSYAGRGLEAGECGISMAMFRVKVWMFGCRVHTQNSGWKYAWSDLYAHSSGLLPTTVTPREVVVPLGGDMTILLKAQAPLDICHFYLPGVSDQVNFDEGSKSLHSNGRLRYHGAGVQIGECGLSLHNLSEANNGPARCFIQNYRTITDDFVFVPIVVARAPSKPNLQGFYEGDNITATCSVQGGRPVPSISWLLGDRVVRNDSLDDTPPDPAAEWTWPWVRRAVRQRVTLRLRPEDDNKVLRCVVTHPALPEPLESNKKVSLLRTKMSDSLLNDISKDIETTYSETKRVISAYKPPPEIVSSNNMRAQPTPPRKGPVQDSTGHEYLLQQMCVEEFREYRLRETQAATATAELTLEAARAHAQAEDARARTEIARADEAKLLVEAAESRAKAEASLARVAEFQAKAAEVLIKVAQSQARAEEARAQNAEEQVARVRYQPRVAERGREERVGEPYLE